MNRALKEVLAVNHGVVGWRTAAATVGVDIVEWASRSKAVLQPYPGVLADPALWASTPGPTLRWRAAVIAAGPDVALSHTTALAVWRLPVPDDETVQLLSGPGRRIRMPGIVAHRRAGFIAGPPAAVIRQGVPVTALERSIVDAWPLLTADEQRAPVITAVGERMTTPARIRSAVPGNLPQRQALVGLLALLEAGCRSALEIWGYERVFTGPGFERLRWQVPVCAKGRRYWLDAFDEDTLTNFELDGAKYHDKPSHRGRDVRRDADLAEIGIHAVRFTHHRLTHEVPAVRQQALAIMAVRRSRHWTPSRVEMASQRG